MKHELDSNRPLMLWCSSHDTLANEEIPLFIEAGFRVVPLLTNFWTFDFDEKLDSLICPDWKNCVDMPPAVVDRLQRLKICENEGQSPTRSEDLELLNQHVDVVYMTVLPALAIRLAQHFRGTVMFRPFGHGRLNNYSRIATGMGANLDSLRDVTNFIWCPILTTLHEVEDLRLYRNPQLLTGFVSPSRLGKNRWVAEESEKFVVETIPRIEKQAYYAEVYQKYINDFGDLPLKILGGNSPKGGHWNDARILGRLEDDEYFETASKARISIYHGDSRYHVHYHPVEFMSLGVPVLFHEECAIASEAVRCGLSQNELKSFGMYRDLVEAKQMASRALQNYHYAMDISQRQRFFIEEVFSRKKALDQARWIRSLCVAINRARADQSGVASTLPPVDLPPPLPKPTRPWPIRVARELQRAGRRIRTSLRKAS